VGTILKYLTVLILLVVYSCSYESENREKLVASFYENFGFKPPKSVEKIKVKNWGYYDTQIHWMAFTYNSTVLEKIIAHDQPLNIAENNSAEFQHIIQDLKKGAHHPDWLVIPNERSSKIYYKKDFLDHTFSVYYLWTDEQTAMTFLYVEFFD